MDELELPIRDQKHYYEDGDLVVQVEKTLFRVHKAILKREPSVFTDLFSLPHHPGAAAEGKDDETPLLLSGDTVDEFRAICWSMYAFPSEIYALSSATLKLEEISRFLSLALIAHKYQFTSMESWARGMLDRHCLPGLRAGNAIDFPNTCTETEFVDILRYAVLAEHSALKEVVLKLLLQRVDKRPRAFDLVRALQLSEKYSWRQMQGELYYRVLCETARSSVSTGQKIFTMSTFQQLLPTGLTDTQISNVMQGYFTLNAAGDRIMKAVDLTAAERQSFTIPMLRNNSYNSYDYPGGAKETNRVQGFNIGPTRYKVAVDVIGRLELMIWDIDISRINHWPSDLQTLRDSLSSLLDAVKTELPEYFLGPEPELPMQTFT